FVIPLYRQKKETVASETELGKYNIPTEYLAADLTEAPRISSQLRQAINDIQEKLKSWNIEYNDRIEKHILLYYIAAKKLSLSTKQQIDGITLMKLLPRLHEMIDDDRLINDLYQVVENHVKDEPLSKDKMDKMKQRFEQTGLFSYWS